MKKGISILLLCALLLAGCGQETNEESKQDKQNGDNAGNTESVAETEKEPRANRIRTFFSCNNVCGMIKYKKQYDFLHT